MRPFRKLLAAALAVVSVAAVNAVVQPSSAHAMVNCSPSVIQWSHAQGGAYGSLGACFISSNGLHEWQWQSDGNFVVYSKAHSATWVATWNSHTGGRGKKLAFQTDGNIVVYDGAGHAVWASGHAGNRSSGVWQLRIQDDGNLVEYQTYPVPSYALWNTHTTGQ